MLSIRYQDRSNITLIYPVEDEKNKLNQIT
jgi:hypothetical protein